MRTIRVIRPTPTMPSHKKHLQKIKQTIHMHKQEHAKHMHRHGAYKPLLILTPSPLQPGLLYHSKARYRILLAHDHPPHIARMLARVCVTVSFDTAVPADITCYTGQRRARREKVSGRWCHVDDLYRMARTVKRRSEPVPVVIVDRDGGDVLVGLSDHVLVGGTVLVNGTERCSVRSVTYYDEMTDSCECMSEVSRVDASEVCDVSDVSNVDGMRSGVNEINEVCDVDSGTMAAVSNVDNENEMDSNVDNNVDSSVDIDSKDKESDDEPRLYKELSEYKGIIDINTCRISTGYTFKEPKQRHLTECYRFVMIRLDRHSTDRAYVISSVMYDMMCVMNVMYTDIRTGQTVQADGLDKHGGQANCQTEQVDGLDKHGGQVDGLDKQTELNRQVDGLDKHGGQVDHTGTYTDTGTDTCTDAGTYTVEYGMAVVPVRPVFTRTTSRHVHLLLHTPATPGTVSFAVPYMPTSSVSLFLNGTLLLSSRTYDYRDRAVLHMRVLRGMPYRVCGKTCRIRGLFSTRDDALYFRKVRIEQRDNVGRMVSTVGMRGVVKAVFDRPVVHGEDVVMRLYKLVRLL